MDKSIKVTIGIPVYNGEKYLAQAIQSILNQSFTDFELIITDDGSIDRSLEIARSFNDERIIAITDGLNRGISYRLNQQIEMAAGKYFARMDADDIMFTMRLQKQFEFLEANPGTDITGSHAVIIDNENNIVSIRKVKTFADIQHYFQSNPYVHPTIMGKTEWFRKFGYKSKFDGAEDADLWIRSYNHTKCVILDEPLLFYRDTLTINLKSYLNRTKSLAKVYESNRQLAVKTFSIRKQNTYNKIKLLIYTVLKILSIEKKIFSKRFEKLNPPQKLLFIQELLKAIQH